MGWRLTVADFIPPFPMVSTGVSLPCFVIHLSWQSLNNGMNSQVWRNWTFQITVGSSLFTLLALKIKLWKFLFVDGCCADFTNSVLGWYLRDWCLVPFFFHVFVKHKSWEYEPLSWEYQPLNFSKTLILFPKNINILNQGALLHISIVQGIVNARRPWWLPISLEKPYLKLPLWWNIIENYTIGVGCAFIVGQVIVICW